MVGLGSVNRNQVKELDIKHDELVAAEVVKPVGIFLRSLHRVIVAIDGNVTPKFLVDFLTAADRLNNQCSQNVAWLLLKHSARPDIRASSEGTLIRMVRSRCFDHLDILGNHPIIKRKRWDEQFAQENAVLNSLIATSTAKLHERKSTVDSLLLSLLFAVPVWFTYSSGTTNLYAGLGAAISALAALICFVRSISTIARYN